MAAEVFILGGAQSDFARNIDREGGGMFELFRDIAEAAFAATRIEPKALETAHVGNFVGELFAGQGQLGDFFGHVHPDLAGNAVDLSIIDSFRLILLPFIDGFA
ncbi:hypothetical protein [Methylicorpusculum sp.]|uniref:hypothetical protein n=1 Tax=Methylicorpusculum sp. TaxID=2713644 RepID=UPI0027317F05|nr:hypothetical protein [Methylicorpusculum sp.]MDP2179943.1 hypothetical protein [Methylicorpusculum sp.]MDZ4150698.1 hypothetical protein [Methylicorpusculum sp.]